MTYKEVYKMVKRAADGAAKKPVKEPQYGVDYLTKATGRSFPEFQTSYWQIRNPDRVLYSRVGFQGGWHLDGTYPSQIPPLTRLQLNIRNRVLSRGLYDPGSEPNKLLQKDVSAQAQRKRNQYNTTGQVTPSRVWKAGQSLPSGLKITPKNVNQINQIFRESASTNRPSSVYKPA